MTALIKWQRPRHAVIRRIPIRAIDIPEEYERKELAEDDAVGRSIKQHGVQQPVVVLQNGDRFTMVKGGRRLRLAEKAGITDLLARIETVPEGVSEKVYRDRLRFVLTKARQDLPPSQKASLVRQVMTMLGISQKEVAALLGYDAGSITNWLAVEQYIEPIKRAIDSKVTTPHHARAFDGMTEDGQAKAFRALRKEMGKMSGDAFQALVRSKFGPKQHPALYVDAEAAIRKLSRKRRAKKRAPLTRDEKTALASSLEVAEIELVDLQTDNKRMKRECTLAGPVVSAILRSEKLPAMLSGEMREELERFAEVY